MLLIGRRANGFWIRHESREASRAETVAYSPHEQPIVRVLLLIHLEPRGYSEEEKDLVSRAHRKRGSRRAVSRMFGVSRNALGRWIEKRQLPQCLRKTQLTGKSESPVASWPAHKRFFGRLRQKLARQVRRTRAASQSERTGHLTTKLFVEWYNEAAT